MSDSSLSSLCFATLLIAGNAVAEPKVTYVGLGRYSCSGSTEECRDVHRRNDELAEREANKASLEQTNRMMRESLRENERQTRILEEIRDQQRRYP